MNSQPTHQLFTKEKIEASTRRIALQILESNTEEKELFIVGIADNGLLFAKRIVKILASLSSPKITLISLQLNKKNPLDKITTSEKLEVCKNRVVIVIDDVLNTGRTLIYAVNHFLQVPLKQLQTAVLVNRNHKRYPIKADFKGLSLSTSNKEHIQVVLEGKDEGVYLS
jgi:pyrimidine operon attenuation protein/uracil phosphoribosyltransferase